MYSTHFNALQKKNEKKNCRKIEKFVLVVQHVRFGFNYFYLPFYLSILIQW